MAASCSLAAARALGCDFHHHPCPARAAAPPWQPHTVATPSHGDALGCRRDATQYLASTSSGSTAAATAWPLRHGALGHARNARRKRVVARALFDPPPFQPEKLTITYLEGACPLQPVPPLQQRRYTLTHNDITGALTLSIGRDYNARQISGFYTRLLRDEVTAEWKHAPSGASSGSGTSGGGGSGSAGGNGGGGVQPHELHLYCHVSGEERWLAPPLLRNYIFRREIPLVLNTFLHADRVLLAEYPHLASARVMVHFESHVEELNTSEAWGTLGDRSTWQSIPTSLMRRLLTSIIGWPGVDSVQDDLGGDGSATVTATASSSMAASSNGGGSSGVASQGSGPGTQAPVASRLAAGNGVAISSAGPSLLHPVAATGQHSSPAGEDGGGDDGGALAGQPQPQLQGEGAAVPVPVPSSSVGRPAAAVGSAASAGAADVGAGAAGAAQGSTPPLGRAGLGPALVSSSSSSGSSQGNSRGRKGARGSGAGGAAAPPARRGQGAQPLPAQPPVLPLNGAYAVAADSAAGNGLGTRGRAAGNDAAMPGSGGGAQSPVKGSGGGAAGMGFAAKQAVAGARAPPSLAAGSSSGNQRLPPAQPPAARASSAEPSASELNGNGQGLWPTPSIVVVRTDIDKLVSAPFGGGSSRKR